MISLKRNDKIIIIVAVVILVFAGVAIAMYQSPEPQEFNYNTTSNESTFMINWTVENGSAETLSDFASKKTVYDYSFQISDANVKSITFNLSWTDDRMTFLKRMGLDRFTLDVAMPDGRTDSAVGTSAAGSGEGTISLSLSSDIIPPKEVKAIDKDEAIAKLQSASLYTDQEKWTNKDIKVNISVKIGEIRLLKQIRDKGNDFELKITYEYYKGMIGGGTIKNTGEDNGFPPEDEITGNKILDYKSPYMTMIISTGCGRYV